MTEGLSHAQACERVYLVKTDGLVIKSRKTLSEQQVPFAKDGPDLKDLYEVVKVENIDIHTKIGTNPPPKLGSETVRNHWSFHHPRRLLRIHHQGDGGIQQTSIDFRTFQSDRQV